MRNNYQVKNNDLWKFCSVPKTNAGGDKSTWLGLTFPDSSAVAYNKYGVGKDKIVNKFYKTSEMYKQGIE